MPGLPGPSVPQEEEEVPNLSDNENHMTSSHDILQRIFHTEIFGEENFSAAPHEEEIQLNCSTPMELKPEPEHELLMPALVPINRQTTRETYPPPEMSHSPGHGWPSYQAYEVVRHDPDALKMVLRPLP
jgi:hypothetical protein